MTLFELLTFDIGPFEFFIFEIDIEILTFSIFLILTFDIRGSEI